MILMTCIGVPYPKVRYPLQQSTVQPVDVVPVLISTPVELTPIEVEVPSKKSERLTLLRDLVIALAPIVTAILKLFGG